MEPAETTKRALLAAVTLLAANPVVLYVLTGSVLASIGGAGACVVAIQGAYRPGRSTLLAAYLLNFVALASVFAYAEVVFDARFAGYAPENLYTVEDGYYFNQPRLLEEFIDKEYVTHYLTNAQGYRVGQDQNAEEPVEQADWLFVGDSFTQGAQVEFEDLYTSRLYAAFPDKVVVNAGISGFGVPQEYRYYIDQGRRLKPSVVFLQLSSFNDLMNVRESWSGLTDHLVQRSDFLRYLLQGVKYENPPELPLGRWTEPFHPDTDGNRAYNVFYTDDDDQKREDLREFVRYLALFKEAVEADSARLVVLFIPTKEQVDRQSFDEVVQAFQIDTTRLDMARPNRLLAQACDSLGIGLVDLLRPFQAATRRPFYDYDEHMNVDGHALMADAIADAVRLGAVRGIPAQGLSPVALSREFSSDRYPVQYAAGGLVSFQSVRDGNSELFLTDSTFVDSQRLTVNDVDESHPMLSPDLGRLVFTEGDAATMETNVVVMAPNGSGRRTLTPGPDEFGAIPAFDGSGQQVAYAGWGRDGQGGYTRPRIVVLDLPTGRQRAITAAGTEAWRPVFAPDGRIAYIKRVGDQFDVFVYDLARGRETRVTSTPYDEWDPSFSPDGRRLVYAARRDGNWDLFVTGGPGRQALRLTRTLGDEWDPSFTPDGRSVLYAGHFGLMKGVYRLGLPTGPVH